MYGAQVWLFCDMFWVLIGIGSSVSVVITSTCKLICTADPLTHSCYLQSWQVWHPKDLSLMAVSLMPRWMNCKSSPCKPCSFNLQCYIELQMFNLLHLWCRLQVDGGDEFFTSYDEVYDSFDAMNLQENLLRGIYAYGMAMSYVLFAINRKHLFLDILKKIRIFLFG